MSPKARFSRSWSGEADAGVRTGGSLEDKRGDCSGRADRMKCTCISAIPGIRNLPRPSIFFAPRGIRVESEGPIWTIRPLSTMTVWWGAITSLSIGTTLTSENAIALCVAPSVGETITHHSAKVQQRRDLRLKAIGHYPRLIPAQAGILGPARSTIGLFDVHGLYLQVSPSGGTWWRVKYRFAGRENCLSGGARVGSQSTRHRTSWAPEQVPRFKYVPARVRRATDFFAAALLQRIAGTANRDREQST